MSASGLIRACIVASGIVISMTPVTRAALPNASVSWPQTYYDAGRESFNPHEKTLSPSNVSSLTLLGGAKTMERVGGFALESGTLYAREQQQGSNSSNDLEAFSASTFAQKWVTNAGDVAMPTHTVVIAGSRFFSACAGGSSGGNGLCAYSTATGKQLWSFFGTPPSGICDTFVYANGVVYVEICNGPSGSDIGVYALNAKSGKPVWSHVTGNNSIQGTSMAVNGGYVYYACHDSPFTDGSGICALNQSDGSQAWRALNHEVAWISVVKGVVYANAQPDTDGGDWEVDALNGATGATLWSNVYTPTCCAGPSPAAVAKGAVYAVTSGPITAFTASTGAVRWSVAANVYSEGLSVANAVIYDVEGAQPSYALTTARGASDGKVLWTTPSCAGCIAGGPPPPIIANGTLYSADMTTNCSICAYGLSGKIIRPISTIRRGIIRP